MSGNYFLFSNFVFDPLVKKIMRSIKDQLIVISDDYGRIFQIIHLKWLVTQKFIFLYDMQHINY